VSDPVRAYVALGSNLGDRLGNLQRAVSLLAGRDGVVVVRSSRVYETEPVGPPQPHYLNAVIEVSTALQPFDLLRTALDVESQMGRVRTERWGPRVIDIDVLTYDQASVDEPGLAIPHPRMHERAFVLVPLAELDGDPPLPDGRRLADLRVDPRGVRMFAPSLSLELPTPSPTRSP